MTEPLKKLKEIISREAALGSKGDRWPASEVLALLEIIEDLMGELDANCFCDFAQEDACWCCVGLSQAQSKLEGL